MNNRYTFFLAAGLTATVLCPAPVAADAAGRKAANLLVRQVHVSPRGKDMAVRATMVLTAEGEDDKAHNLTAFSKRHSPNRVVHRLQFSTPPELADTAILSAIKESGEQHWLFIKGAQDVREVLPASFGKPLLDTQIHYHDLLPRPPQMDEHQIVGEEAIEERLCKVVDSVPLDAASAPFARRRMWVYEKFMLPLRVDYFAVEGEPPRRRYEVHKIQKVG
ncbi:MAG: outer membrane lipoprotein-sorting protein, partial [Gammaproteobacteria bacterium]